MTFTTILFIRSCADFYLLSLHAPMESRVKEIRSDIEIKVLVRIFLRFSS